MTQYEIFKTLLWPAPAADPEVEQRLKVLTTMVFDLLVEVEALRKVAAQAQQAASTNAESGYRRAYEDTAFLTCNADGPSSGLQKLIALFYPEREEPTYPGWTGKHAWRELQMLRRLGASEEQIQAYQRSVLAAETRK